MGLPLVDSSDLQWEFVTCALCGHDEPQRKFSVDLQEHGAQVHCGSVLSAITGVAHIVRCRNCGLVYVNPRLAPMPDMAPYSPEDEAAYFAGVYQIKQTAYQHLLDQVLAWAGGSIDALLDVGCGDGALIELARKAGIRAVGSEVSPALVKIVRERLGHDTMVEPDLAKLPAAEYAAITMINVLEHVAAPAEMLHDAARALKPGGLLFVHVPNLGGLPARLKGVRWYHIHPLVHLYYFEASTLGTLLQKAGLEPLGRFNLVISGGIRARIQRSLGNLGIYLDNGLGLVARRPF